MGAFYQTALLNTQGALLIAEMYILTFSLWLGIKVNSKILLAHRRGATFMPSQEGRKEGV